MPNWRETFDVDVKYLGDELYLRVLDKDMASVDVIGATCIKLSALCCNGGTDDWYEIEYKGKSAGKIHLIGRFVPGAVVDKVGMQMRNMV